MNAGQSLTGHDAELSVKAQALVRVKLGFPVLALIVFSIWYWGPSSPEVGPAQIAAFALLYTAYNFAALYFASHLRPFSAREVVIATAILDPIMLSGWLSMMGQGSILFVCFYLFTILGFGFRTGIVSMRICQLVSLAGFLSVVLSSPVWRAQPLIALSNVIFLIIVPLYASMLIRRLHAAREHAERESRAKSQLLANVSHELRTPLTGIVSSAQLIEAETRDPAAARRAASILKLSAELNTEINNLLDSAKHQANLIVLEAVPFDLEQVAEHLRITLGPIAAVKNIGFSVRVDERLRQPLVGDARYLTSVLNNLAGNAIKFTEQGRADVTIDLMEDLDDRSVLRFAVRDTGIGIPKDLQDKIFEPFFQVSTGAARKYGGTGLGTSIARELVARMGGELHLQSEPGQGSLFWFELSLPKAVAAGPAATPAEAPVRIVGEKHILVADDNAANLMLVKEMLRKDGHLIVTAASGTEALECLANAVFDAVFLDFNMADIDGAQVFEIYRFGRTQTAPTFFITADTTAATAERLRGLGAAGVLHKPVTFEKLRGALASVFADEAVPVADAVEAPAAKADAPRPALSAPLKAVPVEYIDRRALESLREISEAPEFLVEMLSVGIADMERLGRDLVAALDQDDIEAMRQQAHALKGVCLNLGAVRLASLASKLMTVPAAELQRSRGQWRRDIESAIGPSIDGLRAALATAA